MTYTKGSKVHGKTILLKGRFEKIQADRRAGTERDHELRTEENKIGISLLGILDDPLFKELVQKKRRKTVIPLALSGLVVIISIFSIFYQTSSQPDQAPSLFKKR